MPVSAAIKFTQGITTDLAGRALIGVTGAAVAMTNGDNTDVFDWTWELTTKPSASAIATGVLAAGAVIMASFMPDVPGSYLGRLTVKDTLGNQAVDERAFIVTEGSGRIIPPFRGDSASLNYGGQAEGWDPAMESWLHSSDGRQPLVNAATGALNDISSFDLVDLTSAEGIRFTNALSPTVNGIAGGYGGRRLYVVAAGSALAIANQNAGSLAANRIITGTGANVALQSGSIAWLVYDNVDLRWRLQPIGGAGAGVPATRILTAGDGLTGGGDLSADRTFDVVANADGSIVVNANDLQVGVLASDAQHGIRGGGTQHAAVVSGGASGFITGASQLKLDGISALAAALTAVAPADVTKAAAAVGASGTAAKSDHKHDISTAVAVGIGFANAEGVATSLARSDHVHLGAPILMWGNDGLTATTTTRYLTPGYGETNARVSPPVRWTAPRAGTLKNMNVRQGNGAGNGNNIVYTLRVNSVATALAVTIASTANTAAADTDTVAVVAGDLVDIEVTKAVAIGTTPDNCMVTVEFGG